MKITIISVLLVLASGLSAQTYWDIELQAGTNAALSHKPVLSRIDYSGRTYQPSWRVGLTAVMSGRKSKSSLLLGADIINDRLAFNDYEVGGVNDAFFMGDILSVGSGRRGEFQINETQLRVLIGHRINLNPVSLEYGFAISGRLFGGQQFDFVQTTASWVDPITGLPLILEEPLVSSGTAEVPKNELNRNAYTALVLATGYRVTERLAVRLEAELGLVLRRDVLENRYRQQRLRLGLVAAYALYSDK